MNSEFFIGDQVSWKAGKVICKGVFLENANGKSKVLTHFVGNNVTHREIEVECKLTKGWDTAE